MPATDLCLLVLDSGYPIGMAAKPSGCDSVLGDYKWDAQGGEIVVLEEV